MIVHVLFHTSLSMLLWRKMNGFSSTISIASKTEKPLVISKSAPEDTVLVCEEENCREKKAQNRFSEIGG